MFPYSFAVFCASFLLSLDSFAGMLRLSEDGKARYDIVLGGEPATGAEQFAYMELREHLNRVIGAERKNHERFARDMAFEGLHDGERTIYLGWTDFAREQGVDLESLSSEEYIICTVGEDIMIVGGRPRGTLYGVYDFLENQTGVMFAAPGETVIPNKPTLEIPANLVLRRQPGIASRGTSRSLEIFLPDDDACDATTLWRVRNRENQPADISLSQVTPPLWMREAYLGARARKEIGVEPKDLRLVNWHRAYPLWKAADFGGFKRIPHLMHNAFTLVPPEAWQASHPEFFSMRDGKWMENLSRSVATRGDLNYSNKESRPIAAQNLMEEIDLAHQANRRLGDSLQDTFFSPRLTIWTSRKIRTPGDSSRKNMVSTQA